MLIQDDETASEYQMVLIEEVDENLSVSRIAWRVSHSGSCDGENGVTPCAVVLFRVVSENWI